MRPGDLLLYVDPAHALPPTPSVLAPLAERLLALAAVLPMCGCGLSGAEMRTDWTSVACLTVYAKTVHVVAFGLVEPHAPPEFCMYPAAEFLAARRVVRFAIRPLAAPFACDERTLCGQIARVVHELNTLPTVESTRRREAQRDDALLAAEIYWRLTGVTLTDADESSGAPHTVARLFATGGALDRALLHNPITQQRFQFGAEVCGWLPKQ